MTMDKKSGKRPDRYQDRHQDKGKRQQGNRRSEFGTFEDVAKRSKCEREAKRQQKNDSKTRCAHCGGLLRTRGAVGHAGHLRWKCRKCGRTVWIRPDFKPPIPLVPTSKMAGLGGANVQMRRMQERIKTRTDEQSASGS
jgi:hypothetical protein